MSFISSLSGRENLTMANNPPYNMSTHYQSFDLSVYCGSLIVFDLT